MPFARTSDHPKEASRSEVGNLEGGWQLHQQRIASVQELERCSVYKRLKGCKQPLETSELRTKRKQLCENHSSPL